MRRIVPLFFVALVVTLLAASCRMAPSQELGDTVAAIRFYPPDTAAINARARAAHRDSIERMAHIKDAVDTFVIAEGSDKQHLVLLSYPTHRDTLSRARTAHIRVTGRADIGAVAHIGWYVTPRGDSLVSSVTVVE